MLPLLQAFSLHSSVSSPGLLHHSSDPSGMATPQLLEHASSGASQLQHSVDASHQVQPAISHAPPDVYSTISCSHACMIIQVCWRCTLVGSDVCFN